MKFREIVELKTVIVEGFIGLLEFLRGLGLAKKNCCGWGGKGK